MTQETTQDQLQEPPVDRLCHDGYHATRHVSDTDCWVQLDFIIDAESILSGTLWARPIGDDAEAVLSLLNRASMLGDAFARHLNCGGLLDDAQEMIDSFLSSFGNAGLPPVSHANLEYMTSFKVGYFDHVFEELGTDGFVRVVEDVISERLDANELSKLVATYTTQEQPSEEDNEAP